MVHNLRLVDWQNPNGTYNRAKEMNSRFNALIGNGIHKDLINYPSLGKEVMMEVSTAEHNI